MLSAARPDQPTCITDHIQMANNSSLEKTLMLGKIEGKRKMGQQRMRWLDGLSTQWM